MKTKPFLKWCGGKTQILPQLLTHIPSSYGTYYEPFLGGGALFFALKPQVAELSDVNKKLINAYNCIAYRLQQTVKHLQTFDCNEICFYKQRELINLENLHPDIRDPEAAARFIYLNKTCFNGLWRENSLGKFNTPYGGDRKISLIDAETLLSCSLLFVNNITLRVESFENINLRAKKNDLIYFDPPYIPLVKESFVDYTSQGFGINEQIKLRDLAKQLKKRGCHVIISNSDTSQTRELYQGFTIETVQARRSINNVGTGRGRVGELIIT